MIQQNWNGTINNNIGVVTERLRNSRKEVAKWLKQNNTNSAKEIKSLTKAIVRAHTDGVTTLEQIHEMRKDLLQAYLDEEGTRKPKVGING